MNRSFSLDPSLEPLTELLLEALAQAGLLPPDAGPPSSAAGFSRWYLEVLQRLEARVMFNVVDSSGLMPCYGRHKYLHAVFFRRRRRRR